jgi:hypothetical protein
MAGMPRRGRCVIPGVPCHVTQRGVNRRAAFSVDDDRLTYLGLLRDNLADGQVRILAFRLMTNDVISRPDRSRRRRLASYTGDCTATTRSTTTRAGRKGQRNCGAAGMRAGRLRVRRWRSSGANEFGLNSF